MQSSEEQDSHQSLRPLGNRVVVEPIPQLEEKLYASLIHIPENRMPSFTDMARSKVIALGSRLDLSVDIHVGDIVLHNNQMGMKIPNTPFLLLHGDDIVAKAISSD